MLFLFLLCVRVRLFINVLYCGASLWIIYVILSCICYAFVRVCLLMPCGHLLGKDWPLVSRL